MSLSRVFLCMVCCLLIRQCFAEQDGSGGLVWEERVFKGDPYEYQHAADYKILILGMAGEKLSVRAPGIELDKGGMPLISGRYKVAITISPLANAYDEGVISEPIFAKVRSLAEGLGVDEVQIHGTTSSTRECLLWIVRVSLEE